MLVLTPPLTEHNHYSTTEVNALKNITNFSPTNNDLTSKLKVIQIDKHLSPKQQLNAVRIQKAKYDHLLAQTEISIPFSTASSKTQAKANDKYLTFVNTHKNNPLLSEFRNRYAKAVLEDEELAETEDYNKIKYYVKELIEVQSTSIDLIIKSLEKLKGKIPNTEYKNLKASATNHIENRGERDKNLILFLKKRIAQLKSNPNTSSKTNVWPEFTIVLLERRLHQLKKHDSTKLLQKVAAI